MVDGGVLDFVLTGDEAVEDCEGFQATYYLSAENRALPMIIDSFAGARNDRKGIRKEISPRASLGRNDKKGTLEMTGKGDWRF